MADDLTRLETHFAFGENWRAFAEKVDAGRLAAATEDLHRLLPADALQDRTFLDIGCGSGLVAAAALRSGCRSVVAVDLDPESVATAAEVLRRHGGGGSFTCRRASVLELDPQTEGTFDIVHSWGVLHHTGAMWQALEQAARLVAPGGSLAIAIYRKTPLCGLWRVEKRLYTAAPEWARKAARLAYKGLFLSGLLATGRNPAAYVKNYAAGRRGMDFDHDIHDWLGGYPYESASPAEITAFFQARGFRPVRSFARPPGLGLLGTGCDEFVFARADGASSPG